jgi:hypothetical protein
MSDELNEMVGDLLNQLEDANKKVELVKKVSDPLTKETMEKFVIEKAGRLVEESLDVVNNMKDFVSSAPESRDISSLSELINATASAIETLNKLIVAEKRNETIIKAKTMDIESRKDLAETTHNTKLLATREEVFKALMAQAVENLNAIETQTQVVPDKTEVKHIES